jgi:hypothetical protein
LKECRIVTIEFKDLKVRNVKVTNFEVKILPIIIFNMFSFLNLPQRAQSFSGTQLSSTKWVPETISTAKKVAGA